MNHLIYNGTDLTEYGLYVSGDKTFDAPQKNYTQVTIPGRSGDLYVFDGTYMNVELQYKSIIIEDFSNNMAEIRNILLSPTDYVTIEDDYHPDEFRLGVYLGPLTITPLRLSAGSTILTFNCRPERWLKSGAYYRDFDSFDFTISNPTPNISKPLFKILPKDSDVRFDINNSLYQRSITILIAPRDYTVYLDCEFMDLYSITPGRQPIPDPNSQIEASSLDDESPSGNTDPTIYQDSNGYVHISPEVAYNLNHLPYNRISRNNLLTVTNNIFPEFAPGSNKILSTSPSYISYIPRWYIL